MYVVPVVPFPRLDPTELEHDIDLSQWVKTLEAARSDPSTLICFHITTTTTTTHTTQPINKIKQDDDNDDDD